MMLINVVSKSVVGIQKARIRQIEVLAVVSLLMTEMFVQNLLIIPPSRLTKNGLNRERKYITQALWYSNKWL